MGSYTITDVAALARVSIKTVSRVLNKEAHVRPEMRERVMQAAEQLNYKPNIAARALAGSRAYLIGLCYDNPSPGYIGEMQIGAMNGCRKAGYHLLIEQLDTTAATFHQQVATLLDSVKMDGIILSPPVCDRTEMLDILDQKGIRYVRIAPAGHLERSPYVYMDDRRAAYEMTVHLQKLGHTRIGFVRGHAEHFAAALRYEGFKDAMRDASIKVPREWVQPGKFSFRSGMAAGEKLLQIKNRPTAIFASNDDMALGVMAIANRLHLRLPEDLSVSGFDDSPVVQVVWPQLTTIRQPVMEMAAEAASILVDGGKSAKNAKGRLMDFELVIRGSTAPVGG